MHCTVWLALSTKFNWLRSWKSVPQLIGQGSRSCLSSSLGQEWSSAFEKIFRSIARQPKTWIGEPHRPKVFDRKFDPTRRLWSLTVTSVWGSIVLVPRIRYLITAKRNKTWFHVFQYSPSYQKLVILFRVHPLLTIKKIILMAFPRILAWQCALYSYTLYEKEWMNPFIARLAYIILIFVTKSAKSY